MNFTNINDTAGVKALLEQLQSSNAWKETITTPPDDAAAAAASSSSADAAQVAEPANLDDVTANERATVSASSSSSSSGPSVAALLAQLRSSTVASAPPSHTQGHRPAPAERPGQMVIDLTAEEPPAPEYVDLTGPDVAPVAPRPNVRSYSLKEALPHLAGLSDDPRFVSCIQRMKAEQADVENQLWLERLAVQKKQEERVKVARKSAAIVGSGITQHQADSMSESFRKELAKFDLERVLPAIDGLVAKQQAALEAMSVPAMFVTAEGSDRERQQKVMQVLEGIVGGAS